MDKAANSGDFYGPKAGWTGYPEALIPEDLLFDDANINTNWKGCEMAVGEFAF